MRHDMMISQKQCVCQQRAIHPTIFNYFGDFLTEIDDNYDMNLNLKQKLQKSFKFQGGV